MHDAEDTGDRLRRAVGLLTAWVDLEDDPVTFRQYARQMTTSPEETEQLLAGLTALAGLLMVLLVGKSPTAQHALLERIARDYG